jgi:hypothetical protein
MCLNGIGRVIVERARFDAPTSRAFRQMDLYSTFFGTSVNDEIERRLFGNVDSRGAEAIRAFAGTDINDGTGIFKLFSSTSISKKFVRRRDWIGLRLSIRGLLRTT